jgi:hypothetical protein
MTPSNRPPIAWSFTVRTSTTSRGSVANVVCGSSRLPVAKQMNRSPLVLAPGAAHPGDPETRSLGEALALVGEQRRVGRDDDDDRARAGRRRRRGTVVVLGAVRRGHLRGRDRLADRHAVDPQPLAPAVVRLDEDADGPAALCLVDDPRRRPDPALELVADHPRPAADVALDDRPARRRRHRLVDVIHRHVEAVDVVEQPVPRLAGDRQRPERRPERQLPDRVADDPVVTIPTLWVFVMPIGPARRPASRIHSRPVSSPLPFRR